MLCLFPEVLVADGDEQKTGFHSFINQLAPV